ncbi:MAG: arylesterase [Paracoccaceae bacterium]
MFRNLSILLFFVSFICGTVGKVNAGPVVIAVLGDSLVQGYGLPQEDGFVVQLGDWLTDQNIEVQLINAGVSGDTTAGGLSRVDWTLTPEVDGLIVSLGGNDVLRGIDPVTARSNLTGILSVAKEHELPVLLVGILAPGNYGANYKKDFEAIYPELATSFETLLYTNFIGTLVNRPDRAATMAEYFQADRLHPNAKGVAEIVGDMGPKVVELVDQITCAPDC